jgi:Ca2+/Na+ antiporter
LIADQGTRVDWWIITRDTIFILVYLTVITAFLIGNSVSLYQAIVLFILYLVHIILMKYNHVYEVAIKKSVARRMEIKELQKMAKKDINFFHQTVNS